MLIINAIIYRLLIYLELQFIYFYLLLQRSGLLGTLATIRKVVLHGRDQNLQTQTMVSLKKVAYAGQASRHVYRPVFTPKDCNLYLNTFPPHQCCGSGTMLDQYSEYGSRSGSTHVNIR